MGHLFSREGHSVPRVLVGDWICVTLRTDFSGSHRVFQYTAHASVS